ncbi:MAG: STAS domain-containing protein [Roseiarcus sp.]|jgi:anti-anti-sigma regulatory factor
MAKESIWQRRARKCRSAKADYYPKVDLSGTVEVAEDGLPSLRSLDVPAAAPCEAEEDAPPPADLDLPAAAPFTAAPALEEARDVAPPANFNRPAAAPLAAAPATDEAHDEPPPERRDPRPAAPLAAAPAPGLDVSAESLPLPECLDLPAAKPLAEALLERRGKPIVLDASSVHQLGAQCVQVLLSARRTWDADGVPLSIVNCAPRMVEDLQLLGIDSTTLMTGVQPQ